MNLALNARDAMPQGGVLAVETARVTLDAEYARDHWPATAGRFVMIAVSDNGIGMDEDTRTRIFEPFFTTKEAGKGTGLGLATVYGIIKQSNGFIWVYSEPGQGATFKIYLPLIDAAADRYQPKPQPAVVPSGDETILLAEDAPEVRLAARQILERQGYTVLEAPTARTALDMAANMKSPIHLLLTDVVMPELGGRELAEEFAKLRPEAKVLYMSGYTDDAIVRYGVLNAGVAYLQKPFDGEALGRKVRQVLDDAR
jgi:CheY-like chemotaxis protein